MSLRLKNALLAVLAAVCLSLPAAIPGLQASAQAPAPAPAAAPEQAPTFATGTATVILDVVVRDKKGRPVLDIQQGELQVFEEGVPQKIDSFKRMETEPPSVQGAPAPAAPPDATRQLSLVTFVFDQLGETGRRQALRRIEQIHARKGAARLRGAPAKC